MLREAACKVEHRTCGEEVCKCQQHRAFLQRSKKTLCSLQIINVHLDITLGGNNLDQKMVLHETLGTAIALYTSTLYTRVHNYIPIQKCPPGGGQRRAKPPRWSHCQSPTYLVPGQGWAHSFGRSAWVHESQECMGAWDAECLDAWVA